jgi:hypothetical protein
MATVESQECCDVDQKMCFLFAKGVDVRLSQGQRT